MFTVFQVNSGFRASGALYPTWWMRLKPLCAPRGSYLWSKHVRHNHNDRHRHPRALMFTCRRTLNVVERNFAAAAVGTRISHRWP
jgi:hypothetical protein